jgi:flagellar protein FlaJ
MNSEELTKLKKIIETSSIIFFFATIFFLSKTKFFLTYLVVSLIVFILPSWLIYYIESQRRKKLEEFFPNFIRDLSAGIKSGMTVPNAIKNLSKNDYGELSYYIKKLHYQISWGIPVQKSFEYFGILVDDPLIKRTMTIITESTRSGGEVETVLDSVYKSLLQIKQIETERESQASKQVIQNYIIFLVFVFIMVVLQNMLIPTMLDMAKDGSFASALGVSTSGGVDDSLVFKTDISTKSLQLFLKSILEWFFSIQGVFIALVVIQGFFTGIMIGKLGSGKASAGTKHSFILISIGLITLTIAQSLV